jgi:hypothetical protein
VIGRDSKPLLTGQTPADLRRNRVIEHSIPPSSTTDLGTLAQVRVRLGVRNPEPRHALDTRSSGGSRQERTRRTRSRAPAANSTDRSPSNGCARRPVRTLRTSPPRAARLGHRWQPVNAPWPTGGRDYHRSERLPPALTPLKMRSQEGWRHTARMIGPVDVRRGCRHVHSRGRAQSEADSRTVAGPTGCDGLRLCKRRRVRTSVSFVGTARVGPLQ